MATSASPFLETAVRTGVLAFAEDFQKADKNRREEMIQHLESEAEKLSEKFPELIEQISIVRFVHEVDASKEQFVAAASTIGAVVGGAIGAAIGGWAGAAIGIGSGGALGTLIAVYIY